LHSPAAVSRAISHPAEPTGLPAPKSTETLRVVVPRIASAKKNMRKSRAAAERNRGQRAALRTAVKKARSEGATPADKLQASSLLDRAARKGLIHANAAGRVKSRMATKK